MGWAVKGDRKDRLSGDPHPRRGPERSGGPGHLAGLRRPATVLGGRLAHPAPGPHKKLRRAGKARRPHSRARLKRFIQSRGRSSHPPPPPEHRFPVTTAYDPYCGQVFMFRSKRMDPPTVATQRGPKKSLRRANPKASRRSACINWMFTTEKAREKLRKAYPVKES